MRAIFITTLFMCFIFQKPVYAQQDGMGSNLGMLAAILCQAQPLTNWKCGRQKLLTQRLLTGNWDGHHLSV
jgi:hypothetical protein